MLRNTTMSDKELLIACAHKKAAAQQTALNIEFRKWLATYANQQDKQEVKRFHDVLQQLSHVDAGRSRTPFAAHCAHEVLFAPLPHRPVQCNAGVDAGADI